MNLFLPNRRKRPERLVFVIFSTFFRVDYCISWVSPLEIPFGAAEGVVECHGKDAAATSHDGNDYGLLHTGIHHTAVNQVACLVVDGNANIAEALVKMERPQKYNFFIYWHYIN